MQRRSERLKLGPIKRKAPASEDPVKLSDRWVNLIVDCQPSARVSGMLSHCFDSARSRSIAPPRLPRRRGLFQDEPTSHTVVTASEDRLAVQSPAAALPVATSPFALAEPPAALNLDENTPPRKRRQLDEVAEPSAAMDDAPGTEFDGLVDASTDTASPGEPAATPQQQPRHEPEEAATPSTWFTPVRHSRPPRPPSGAAPSGPPPLEAPRSAPPSMPCRMPSFSQWIEESADIAPAPPLAEPSPFASPQPVRRAPAAGGGVDMTDLALMYDPVMATAAGRSPPTPVEKIFQRQQAAAEADDFDQDEFEPAYDA